MGVRCNPVSDQCLMYCGLLRAVTTRSHPEKWTLIINKQTGQNGDSYDSGMDLCRVDMKMEKPPVPIEKLKYTITASGSAAKLQLEWENHIASVSIRAK